MLPPSRVVDELSSSASSAGLPIFHAYGDADDPLRLTVLLADHFGNQRPTRTDEVATCLDPKAAPEDRILALRDVLSRLARTTLPICALVDPDALAPADDEGWEDLEPNRVRRSFFATIMERVDRGGWTLVRTNPGAEVTKRLGRATVEDVPSAPGLRGATTAAFAPECRAAVEWMLERKHLTPADVEEIIGTVEAFDDHVLALTYDALPSTTRKVARLICAVRAPRLANGTFGPLAWTNTPTTAGVPRADVEILRRCGLLIADDPQNSEELRVPRRARRMLEAYARADEGEAREVHGRFLAEDFDHLALGDQLEAHFHAVRARNVPKAIETAKFYDVELKALATELSRDNRDYRAAAELFRVIRDQFNSSDPYVWEYLAFNLALLDKDEHSFGRHETEIREAYGKADELTKQRNPLYRGRFLGYRAERGDDVRSEFNRGMTKFLRDYDNESDAVSRFAEPVLDGVRRGKRAALFDEMFGGWRSYFERVAPRLVSKYQA